jgi:thiosulfate/3-mercaptopyruvate sulfurtransferase
MMAGDQNDILQNNILVDSRWLGEHRADASVVLIDTRSAADYHAGHLKGARHFDPFPFHFADTSERGMQEVRAQLEWIFSALGITSDETLVFYENDSGMRATRTAWLAEYMGHRRARILDGGLKLAGAELTTAVTPVTPSAFAAAPREEISASHEYIVERLGRADVRIFDVRTDEEYFGERVRARRAGAVPGAVHLDWVNNVAANGTFKQPAELRAAFESLGLSPDAEVVAYCQGGYRSANAYYALKLAGYNRVRNYIGSWGEWGNREDLPIEHPRRK